MVVQRVESYVTLILTNIFKKNYSHNKHHYYYFLFALGSKDPEGYRPILKTLLLLLLL